MTEFQIATLAVQEAELDISRSAIRVGIGQIVAGVLQTLVIAGGLLFMRSESPAPAQTHTQRHEETMAAMKAQQDAQQTQHLEIMSTVDMQRRALETLIEQTSRT